MKSGFLKNIQFSWSLAAGVYAVTFLTLLIFAYSGILPTSLNHIPFYDKFGHVILYALATYLGHRVFAYRRVNFISVTVPLFPLLFSIFTVSEEALQALSPHRTLDALDLVASFAGVLLGYWFADKSKNRKG